MITPLPPINTPLNQHSLMAIELWLENLGASRSTDDPCLWEWVTSQWSADLKISHDALIVTWKKDGILKTCSLPYGLNRVDLLEVLNQGP